jgi:hypothetical protein
MIASAFGTQFRRTCVRGGVRRRTSRLQYDSGSSDSEAEHDVHAVDSLGGNPVAEPRPSLEVLA